MPFLFDRFQADLVEAGWFDPDLVEWASGAPPSAPAFPPARVSGSRQRAPSAVRTRRALAPAGQEQPVLWRRSQPRRQPPARIARRWASAAEQPGLARPTRPSRTPSVRPARGQRPAVPPAQAPVPAARVSVARVLLAALRKGRRLEAPSQPVVPSAPGWPPSRLQSARRLLSLSRRGRQASPIPVQVPVLRWPPPNRAPAMRRLFALIGRGRRSEGRPGQDVPAPGRARRTPAAPRARRARPVQRGPGQDIPIRRLRPAGKLGGWRRGRRSETVTPGVAPPPPKWPPRIVRSLPRWGWLRRGARWLPGWGQARAPGQPVVRITIRPAPPVAVVLQPLTVKVALTPLEPVALALRPLAPAEVTIEELAAVRITVRA